MFCRGGFLPSPQDGLGEAAAVVLIGNAGTAFWRSAASGLAETTDPLDDWTRRVLSPIAGQFGARAVFPFEGPPYHPFQQWAQRAEAVFPSPIGPLVHPEFGLWHAYRAAFLMASPVDVPAHSAAVSPCEECADKPCLTTCPVGAFETDGYDVPACVAHMERPEGADCLDLGCRARRACPVGPQYLYPPDQARLHMAAFVAAQRASAGDA
jgi:hypothetical protein